MNIKGLFEYDSLKLAKDNLEAELLMAKITATELTKQNDDLNAKILAQDKEIESLTRENEALKKDCKVKWHYTELHTSQGSISGWVPIDGTTLSIMKSYPAIFPEYTQEKKVPEV